MRIIRNPLIVLVGLWLAVAMPSVAVIEDYTFTSDVERQRYQSFVEELRCPKCQNQNLAGSDSPIASDLRRELYRLLKEGKSDTEITSFMVNRYGDYVLYRPQVKKNTIVCGGGPILLALLAVLSVGLVIRSRRRVAGAPEEMPINDHDQERLAQLLKAAAERANGKDS